MADIITNTKTVLVRLTSAAQDARSVTLDNPRDNITLAQIRQAFTPILNMRLLLGNKGDNLDAVESATVTTSQKVKLGDSDIEITVTPNALTVYDANPSDAFVVEGSKVIGGYFTNLLVNGSAGAIQYTRILPNPAGTNLSVEIKFSDTPPAGSLTGTLNIVTEARTIQIPVVQG